MEASEIINHLNRDDSLDEFRIGGFLSRGNIGLSEVYETWDSRNVIKLFNLYNDSKYYEDVLRSFKNEPKLLKQMLHSEYIVNASTDFRQDVQYNSEQKIAPYFAMEKMDGTISDLSPNLSIIEKLDVIQQIISGVIDLQDENICHNDLHLDNILFRRIGSKVICKISDFGSATSPYSENTLSDSWPRGKVYHSSPESIAGLLVESNADKDIIKASDIFCLGLTIYEILTSYKQYELQSRLTELYYNWRRSTEDKNLPLSARYDQLNTRIIPSIYKELVKDIGYIAYDKDELIVSEINQMLNGMLEVDYRQRLTDLHKIRSHFADIKIILSLRLMNRQH